MLLKFIKTYCCIFIVFAFLSGCGATIGQVGLGEHSKAQKLVHLQPGENVKVSLVKFAENPSSSSTGLGGFTVIRDEKIEKYLRSIAKRLLKYWHGERPERIGIFVIDGPYVKGYATPSGDIFISLGAFDRLKSEDELAALIAHEMGHLLLKHFKDEKGIRQAAKVANVAGSIWSTRSIINNTSVSSHNNLVHVSTNQNAVAQDRFQGHILREGFAILTEDILLHGHSRLQEYQADQFSGENMKYAGYDHTALFEVLERIRSGEKEQAKIKQDIPKVYSIDGFISTFATTALGNVRKYLRRTHPKAEDRIKSLSKHLSSHFGQGAQVRPTVKRFHSQITAGRFGRILKIHRLSAEALKHAKLKNFTKAKKYIKKALTYKESKYPDTRLVIYNILIEANEKNRAYQLLRHADKSLGASLSFYVTLAKEYTSRKKRHELDQLYYHAERKLPYSSMIYLSQIDSYRKLNDFEKVNSILKKCELNGDKQLLKHCKLAVAGKSLDDDYKNKGSQLFKNLTNSGEMIKGLIEKRTF